VLIYFVVVVVVVEGCLVGSLRLHIVFVLLVKQAYFEQGVHFPLECEGVCQD